MAELEYEIRVCGLVPATVLEEFEGVHVVVHPTTTVMRGEAGSSSPSRCSKKRSAPERRPHS